MPFFQHKLSAPLQVCKEAAPGSGIELRFLFDHYKGLPRRCVKLPNLDFAGHDLPGNPVNSHSHNRADRTHTFQECASACLANPHCTHFTLAHGLVPHECYLKSSGAGATKVESSVGKNSMHSGDCTTADATEAAQTVVFRPRCSTGLQPNTYGSFTDAYNLDNNQPMTGTLQQCIAACIGDCVAFSWQFTADIHQQRACYLKKIGPQTGKHWPAGWTTYTKSCPSLPPVQAVYTTDGGLCTTAALIEKGASLQLQAGSSPTQLPITMVIPQENNYSYSVSVVRLRCGTTPGHVLAHLHV